MSDYVKNTNYAVKDGYTTGDSRKAVKGTELDAEFNDIADAVASKADLASPALTGTPTAPTASAGTSSTQVATTAFVGTAITNERTASATLTNKTLTAPTITSPVINQIVHEGTDDAYETTLAFTDPTADRTITFPDKSGTVAMTDEIASTAILTSASGTYAVAGSSTVTVNITAHGRSVDDVVYLNFTSGDLVDGTFTITAVTTNSFEFNYGSTVTASGNVTEYHSTIGTVALASSDEAIKGTSTGSVPTVSSMTSAIRASFVQGTAQTTTSGTSFDFTGIPSWVKRVTVMFNGVSLSGSSEIVIQLGYGSTPTYKDSGYTGSVSSASGGSQAAYSNGLQINAGGSSSYEYYGAATIINFSSNKWVCTSEIASAISTFNENGAGGVDLGATLTAIRVTTLNGTDTFDAGSINIIYE